MTIRILPVRSVDLLGPEWDQLFEGGAGLQTSRTWWRASAAAALPADARASFVAVLVEEAPAALFPMRVGPAGAHGSLTTPYTCVYQPLFAPDLPDAARQEATLAFARYCRRWPVTRLEALDADWAGLPALREGLRAGGLRLRAFVHFANWHTTVPGPSWAAYLAERPGALRETIRRKRKAFARAADQRIEIADSGAALDAALRAYEDVYARSWKEPEPFPAFNGALVHGLAGSGQLRIAVMWRGGTPIAAQYWTVQGGVATVLKLAHDEAHKALSPGTLLTAAAIEHLIEAEGIAELDFGRGDDAYKRAWAGVRRERIGLIALNVARPRAWPVLLRHEGGQAWRWLRARTLVGALTTR